MQPVLEVVAPVASEGAGFAPNFVPLALWMGAVMTGFLFHFRRLPRGLMAAPRAATVAGRLVFPALVVAGQSLLMLAMLVGVLHVPVPRVLPFAATLLVASLLFLSLIFALVHLFGDIGKMVAVLLLVVQMSAAGALLPIELTAPLFQAAAPVAAADLGGAGLPCQPVRRLRRRLGQRLGRGVGHRRRRPGARGGLRPLAPGAGRSLPPGAGGGLTSCMVLDPNHVSWGGACRVASFPRLRWGLPATARSLFDTIVRSTSPSGLTATCPEHRIRICICSVSALWSVPFAR